MSTNNILPFARPMPAGDPFHDVWIGDNEALVRRAEAGQAEALIYIFGILEFHGRNDWHLAEVDLLARFGISDLPSEDEDGPLVARIARACPLREELAIAAALDALEAKWAAMQKVTK